MRRKRPSDESWLGEDVGMKKRVLNIGQCGPDTASLTHFLTAHFDVEIVSTKLPPLHTARRIAFRRTV